MGWDNRVPGASAEMCFCASSAARAQDGFLSSFANYLSFEGLPGEGRGDSGHI